MSSSFSTILFGEVSGSVRNLRGFKTYHWIPESHTSAAVTFVEAAGAEEVAAQAEDLFGEIRRAFRYKRREIDLVCDGGAASIRTPDFELVLSLTQHPDAPGDYRLRTEISEFRDSKLVLSEPFTAIFDSFCDTVALVFPEPIDLENAIDRIEEVDELAEILDYDAQCTRLTLAFPKLALEIFSQEMRFRLPGLRNLSALLIETESAIEKLSESGLLFD